MGCFEAKQMRDIYDEEENLYLGLAWQVASRVGFARTPQQEDRAHRQQQQRGSEQVTTASIPEVA